MNIPRWLSEIKEKWINVFDSLIWKSQSSYQERAHDIIDLEPYYRLSDRVWKWIDSHEFFRQLHKDITPQQQEIICKYCIKNGYCRLVISFVKEFAINTENFSKDIFLSGFSVLQSQIGKGISYTEVAQFLSVYPNSWEFYDKIMQLGYIEVAYELKLQHKDRLFRKYNEEEMVQIIRAYTARKERGALFFGMGIPYEDIFHNIFQNPKKGLELVQNALVSDEEEKNSFLEILKHVFLQNNVFNAHVLEKFEENLDRIVEEFKKRQFQLIEKKIIQNPLAGNSEFKKLSTRVMLENTSKTPLCVILKDAIGNMTHTFILQESELYMLTSDSRFVQIHSDKQKFLEEIKKAYMEGVKMTENNIPFSVLLFKMNGQQVGPTIQNFAHTTHSLPANDEFFDQARKVA